MIHAPGPAGPGLIWRCLAGRRTALLCGAVGLLGLMFLAGEGRTVRVLVQDCACELELRRPSELTQGLCAVRCAGCGELVLTLSGLLGLAGGGRALALAGRDAGRMARQSQGESVKDPPPPPPRPDGWP